MSAPRVRNNGSRKPRAPPYKNNNARENKEEEEEGKHSKKHESTSVGRIR